MVYHFPYIWTESQGACVWSYDNTVNLLVVLPSISMMLVASRLISRLLNGRTRTATFTDDISTPQIWKNYKYTIIKFFFQLKSLLLIYCSNQGSLGGMRQFAFGLCPNQIWNISPDHNKRPSIKGKQTANGSWLQKHRWNLLAGNGQRPNISNVRGTERWTDDTMDVFLLLCGQ